MYAMEQSQGFRKVNEKSYAYRVLWFFYWVLLTNIQMKGNNVNTESLLISVGASRCS